MLPRSLRSPRARPKSKSTSPAMRSSRCSRPVSKTSDRAMSAMNDLGPEYGAVDDDTFVARYRARCHCGAVCYEVAADPLDAKICHCRTCQTLHGAPMQWAAIFPKHHVRLVCGIEHLRFYSSEL